MNLARSFLKQKNDYLANSKSESEKENKKYQKMWQNSTVWELFRYCVKLPVQVDDGFHDIKINISSAKKQ